jgi:hypothetical protein
MISGDGGPAQEIISAEKIEGQPGALQPVSPEFRHVSHEYNIFIMLVLFSLLEVPRFFSTAKKLHVTLQPHLFSGRFSSGNFPKAGKIRPAVLSA